MNHDTSATDDQRLNLSIRSAQKTWSVFAQAFSTSARDFGACTPKFSLVAMMNWHLDYKGPECIELQDGIVHVQEGQNQEIDPLVLANGLAGLNLNHNIVVLDPVEVSCEGAHDDGGQTSIISK